MASQAKGLDKNLPDERQPQKREFKLRELPQFPKGLLQGGHYPLAEAAKPKN